jgi:hypothetical protein
MWCRQDIASGHCCFARRLKISPLDQVARVTFFLGMVLFIVV